MSNDKPNAPSPLADIPDGELLRGDEKTKTQTALYETMMKNGGEPFGAPFEVGTSSLTSKIVKFFGQLGFFSFETMERLHDKNRRNKFTRHGAAPHRGAYRRNKK